MGTSEVGQGDLPVPPPILQQASFRQPANAVFVTRRCFWLVLLIKMAQADVVLKCCPVFLPTEEACARRGKHVSNKLPQV